MTPNEDKILREVVEEAYLELFGEIQLKETTIEKLASKVKIHLGEQAELQRTITKLERELVKKDKKIAELKKTLQTERSNK